MLVALPMVVGLVVLETWPARPRTWIGWAMTLLVVGPVLLFGEVAGDALLRRAPADLGRRVSLKRIAWLLGVLLILGCVLFAIRLVQSQFLGDPLSALGRG